MRQPARRVRLAGRRLFPVAILDERDDFTRLCVTPELRLREDEIPVNGDLEDAAG